MSKNKSRAGIALIIVLVLVLLGIGAYVGYTYVQSDVNGISVAVYIALNIGVSDISADTQKNKHENNY